MTAPEENPALIAALAGLNVAAVQRDIEALSEAKKLLANSDALQSLALTLAMTLDMGAQVATASVAKELRAVMAELRCEVASDTVLSFLASLGIPTLPAAVRDTEKPGKGNARAGSRKRDGATGVPSDPVATTRP